MSGLEKIIEHIESDAAANADKLIAAAKAEAEKIVTTGKEDADARKEAILKQSEIDVSAARKRIESAADQTLKRYILQDKQQEIDSVITEAVETLKGLDKADYFEVILHMAARYATGQDGIIRFSEADLKRMPKGFEKKINEALEGRAKLTVSKDPVDIDGGFVLDYGDIEENCSFRSLIEASREELADKIGQVLFE